MEGSPRRRLHRPIRPFREADPEAPAQGGARRLSFDRRDSQVHSLPVILDPPRCDKSQWKPGAGCRGEPMEQAEPVIRNISDTANWAAVYRARETARPDALFRDPFARRLAGERGEQIFASMPDRDRNEWAWVTRTFLFDQIITDQVGQGVDMVVNLAAGLDARPYRMPLPASLKWIEVDLQDILAYKEALLQGERPACALERIRLDLANVDRKSTRLNSSHLVISYA